MITPRSGSPTSSSTTPATAFLCPTTCRSPPRPCSCATAEPRSPPGASHGRRPETPAPSRTRTGRARRAPVRSSPQGAGHRGRPQREAPQLAGGRGRGCRRRGHPGRRRRGAGLDRRHRCQYRPGTFGSTRARAAVVAGAGRGGRVAFVGVGDEEPALKPVDLIDRQLTLFGHSSSRRRPLIRSSDSSTHSESLEETCHRPDHPAGRTRHHARRGPDRDWQGGHPVGGARRFGASGVERRPPIRTSRQ